MKEYRMGKKTTEHYTSLEEMRIAWGVKPNNKKTSDSKKLNEQKEKFCLRHKCRACGQPMVYYPGGFNTMVCKNEKCKGIKIEKEDKDGNKIVTYTPSYDILDDKGSEIARNIFE